MSTFQGVILDVDGTLVDSNQAHARAWLAAFREQGYNADFDQILRLVGMGGDHLIPEVCGLDKDSPEGEAINKRRGEMFKTQELPKLKAFPQTRELLEAMRACGLRLAVASSAQSDELTPLLELAGAKDLIEAQTSSSDAQKSKPDPDIVQAALAKLGLEPAQTVMLGDTPYDIESAGKAGVRVIALRSGGWDDQALHGALAIYDDPADLLAHFEQSPLA